MSSRRAEIDQVRNEDHLRSGGGNAAHRPSRIDEIIRAAMKVFSETGLQDSSVQQIADEAGVVSTAVYYHFEGKEDLFDACFQVACDSLTAALVAVRADDEPAGPETFRRIIAGVWKWGESHSVEARMLYLHLPAPTSRSRQIEQAWMERHFDRGYAYLGPVAPAKSRKAAKVQHAAHSLTVRTLISMAILVHPMRMEPGPLCRYSENSTKKALATVAIRLLSV